MSKEFDKVMDDYKDVLLMLDDYDHSRLTEEQLSAIQQEQKKILNQSVGTGI